MNKKSLFNPKLEFLIMGLKSQKRRRGNERFIDDLDHKKKELNVFFLN